MVLCLQSWKANQDDIAIKVLKVLCLWVCKRGSMCVLALTRSVCEGVLMM